MLLVGFLIGYVAGAVSLVLLWLWLREHKAPKPTALTPIRVPPNPYLREGWYEGHAFAHDDLAQPRMPAETF